MFWTEFGRGGRLDTLPAPRSASWRRFFPIRGTGTGLNSEIASFAGGVCVIVPAYNAARTIGDTIRTALAEPEVAEVIVVDDASSDDTAGAARSAAAGDPRLSVIRLERNAGPAAARNAALAVAASAWIAIVDADDFLLPGRFARLGRVPDCDLVADNILFVSEDTGPECLGPAPAAPAGAVIEIGLEGFVRANLSGRGGERSEWGFLKPVIRRDFLQRHGLGYDAGLRLGEDYDLYVRMLQRGARFRVSPQVGYAARWRADSLSAKHRTGDLEALTAAAYGHLDYPGMSAPVRSALADQYRDCRKRFLLRQFLDIRAREGRARAVLSAFAAPTTLLPIAQGVLADKRAARRPAAARSRVGRLLIEGPPSGA